MNDLKPGRASGTHAFPSSMPSPLAAPDRANPGGPQGHRGYYPSPTPAASPSLKEIRLSLSFGGGWFLNEKDPVQRYLLARNLLRVTYPEKKRDERISLTWHGRRVLARCKGLRLPIEEPEFN